ncbi:hypothetical protein C1645_153151 [Glomus cerebriforme]|uniref:Secreted protein n=1 Tax=Glomus cerebriforme TaxID=658196 RepID=A0A397TP55_9GLOM|nr:hypothetical protein C1645_153151 [Glomus cerebriforme]
MRFRISFFFFLFLKSANHGVKIYANVSYSQNGKNILADLNFFLPTLTAAKFCIELRHEREVVDKNIQCIFFSRSFFLLFV